MESLLTNTLSTKKDIFGHEAYEILRTMHVLGTLHHDLARNGQAKDEHG